MTAISVQGGPVLLGDVSFAGPSSGGTAVVSGLSLILDRHGLTVVATEHGSERIFPWTETTAVAFRQPALLPDGRPATILQLDLQGRPLQFLIPYGQVPPAEAQAFEAMVGALVAGQALLAPAPAPAPGPAPAFLPPPVQPFENRPVAGPAPLPRFTATSFDLVLATPPDHGAAPLAPLPPLTALPLVAPAAPPPPAYGAVRPQGAGAAGGVGATGWTPPPPLPPTVVTLGRGRPARRRRLRRLATAGVVVLVAAGGGSLYLTRASPDTTLPVSLSSNDQALASGVDLTSVDLGPSWVPTGVGPDATGTVEPPSVAVQLEQCTGTSVPEIPQLLSGGAGPAAVVAAPTFTDDGGATEVRTFTMVFPSVGAADLELTLVSRPRFGACLQAAMVSSWNDDHPGAGSASPGGAVAVYPVTTVGGASGEVMVVPVTLSGVPGTTSVTFENAYVTSGPIVAEIAVTTPRPIDPAVLVHWASMVQQRAIGASRALARAGYGA